VPTTAQANGAIYQAGHDVALFENAVARRVCDTLTIRLNERTNASKSSTTSTSKSTNIDLPGPIIAGRPVTANGTEILSASVDNNAEFDGEGASTQSNRLEGDITVTVAQRLSNGNLLVRGQKWISINQGQEYVRIQGIVRPIDIDPDNTISSLKVADAMIAYGGKGALANANSPGLLARFFNLPFLPF
jgi:flagellar L-ring protein precursor FlgH